MDKKIAVIGGNGYLGHYVAKYFNAEPLSRKNGFDITRIEDCKKLSDYDVVIHMAAMVDKSDENPDEVFKVNAFGTLNVAQTLKKDQVLIFASTKEVHTPSDSYAYSKLIAEKCIEYYSKQAGFKAGIFRQSSIYAPATNGSTWFNFFIKSAEGGEKLTFLSKGKQVRDLLYVDDLSRAFEMFVENPQPFAVYDIGGGKDNAMSFEELVKAIGEVVGKEPDYELSDEKAKGTLEHITDISEIKKELGWEPKIGLKEGIKKVA